MSLHLKLVGVSDRLLVSGFGSTKPVNQAWSRFDRISAGRSTRSLVAVATVIGIFLTVVTGIATLLQTYIGWHDFHESWNEASQSTRETGVRQMRWVAMLLLVVVSSVAAAQVTPRFDLLDNNVVRVQARHPAQDGDRASLETGTGVVVSVQPGVVRVLTAAHVVAGANQAEVFFVTDKLTPIPAKVLPASSDSLDLAMLEVTLPKGARVPERFMVLEYGSNANLFQSEHVWTVNGNWDPVPNTIVHLDFDGDPQRFEYTQVSMGEGYSGGPVFDDGGHLLGIHGKSTHVADYNLSVAVKMESALDTLVALVYNRAMLNGLVAAKTAVRAGGAAGGAAGAQTRRAPTAKQTWRDLSNNQIYLVQQDSGRMYIRQANGTVVADLAFKVDKKGVKRYVGNSSLSSCPGGRGYMEIDSWTDSRLDGRVEQVPQIQNGKCGGMFGMMRSLAPIAFLREP